ncbi:hypothetical protein ABZ923_32880 [Streptomyces sp. NPDC046881]|uniref:hypothetical protein n=1 Tax=Streptomyces sp. NPDC046881 TaxID=3155374 RepID=UPI0033F7B794
MHQTTPLLKIGHRVGRQTQDEGGPRQPLRQEVTVEGGGQAVVGPGLEQDVAGQLVQCLAGDVQERLLVRAGVRPPPGGGTHHVGLGQLRQDVHPAVFPPALGQQRAGTGQLGDGAVQQHRMVQAALDGEEQPQAEHGAPVVLLLLVRRRCLQFTLHLLDRAPEVRQLGGDVQRLGCPGAGGLPPVRAELLQLLQPPRQLAAPGAVRGQRAVPGTQFLDQRRQCLVVTGALRVAQFEVRRGQEELQGERRVERQRAVAAQSRAQLPQGGQGAVRVVEAAAVQGGLLQDLGQVHAQGHDPPGVRRASVDRLPEQCGRVVQVAGVTGPVGQQPFDAGRVAPLVHAGLAREVPDGAVEVGGQAGLQGEAQRPVVQPVAAVVGRIRRRPLRQAEVGRSVLQELQRDQQVGVEPGDPAPFRRLRRKRVQRLQHQAGGAAYAVGPGRAAGGGPA